MSLVILLCFVLSAFGMAFVALFIFDEPYSVIREVEVKTKLGGFFKCSWKG